MTDDIREILKSLDITPFEIRDAKQGDHFKARALLAQAAHALRHGAPMHPELAEWIADGLETILRDEPAKKAFNLSKPRGHHSEYSEDYKRMVAKSIHGSGLGLHKGLNEQGPVGAYAEAAEQFEISANTAEKWYKEYQDEFEVADELRQAAENEAPLS
jgi:transposase-like protein